MAKVYLFRKIDNTDEKQSDVYEEAARSIVADVLCGSTGTVFNYGEQICHDHGYAEGNAGDGNRDNILPRIICDIFNHVYAMDVTMEINISIKYHGLCVEKQQNLMDFTEEHNQTTNDDEAKRHIDSRKKFKEHFVSSPMDVFRYIDKKLKRNSEAQTHATTSLHSLFVIKVKQNNLEKSKKLYGKLNLVHFSSLDCLAKPLPNVTITGEPETTPMCALLKIISALASNTKTHLRYHNIRLMHMLKDMLGAKENTVILNYTLPGEVHLKMRDSSTSTVCSFAAISADEWQDLYHLEHEKYESLKQKMLLLERCYSSTEEQNNIAELIASLEAQTPNNKTRCMLAQLEAEIQQLQAQLHKQAGQLKCQQLQQQQREAIIERLYQKNTTAMAEQAQLHKEIENVRNEVELTIEEAMEVHHIMEELTLSYDHAMLEMDKKNKLFDKLNVLVIKTTDEMIKQKSMFRNKLAEFSDIFAALWQQQAEALQVQEQEREAQLREMFDGVCTELHHMHLLQLNKLKADAKQKEAELMQLCERQMAMISDGQDLQQTQRQAPGGQHE